MKKLVVLLLALTLLVGGVFAKNIIQIGPSFTWNKPIVNTDIEDFKNFDSSNLQFGADFRLNVPYFQLAAQAGIGGLVGGDSKGFTFNTNITANARFAASIFEFFIGAGANMDFLYSKGDKNWYLNGVTFDDFGDAMGKSNLIYRTGIGLNFGIFGLSLQAIVPTDGTFTENFTMLPDWEATKVTASVLFNFL